MSLKDFKFQTKKIQVAVLRLKKQLPDLDWTYDETTKILHLCGNADRFKMKLFDVYRYDSPQYKNERLLRTLPTMSRLAHVATKDGTRDKSFVAIDNNTRYCISNNGYFATACKTAETYIDPNIYDTLSSYMLSNLKEWMKVTDTLLYSDNKHKSALTKLLRFVNGKYAEISIKDGYLDINNSYHIPWYDNCTAKFTIDTKFFKKLLRVEADCFINKNNDMLIFKNSGETAIFKLIK